jgi:Na+/H+ antiporter NhaC
MYAWMSIIPIVAAIILALLTKNTVFSLAIACIIGCLIGGKGIFGFTDILQSSLGNEDFIWAALNILFFGVLCTYYERSGAIEGFTRLVEKRDIKRRGVQFVAWILGLICFADSMSPLFVGSVMRKLCDKAKVSREKLSYIADSTAAPVSIVYPFTGWSSYLTGLAVGVGCLATRDEAFAFMLKAIPFDFYAILSIVMVLLISLGVVKDYGPMKKAEIKALEADQNIRNDEEKKDSNVIVKNNNVLINFVIPTLLLIILSIGSFWILGGVKVLEAVTIVVILMSISLMIQGVSIKTLGDVFTEGIKAAMPALLVLAVAYPLNAITKDLGAPDFIMSLLTDSIPVAALPACVFLICAILSFSTGTSWGTFAIAMPLVLPMAFIITNNQATLFTTLCFAAVAGGGLFGDHCSPVSDTTIMSSMGAGVEHIDHVKTQLPYAITVATITALLYVVIALIVAP